MKILSLNVNDFGGRDHHREAYKKEYGGYVYLKLWDRLDKAANVKEILSYCETLNPKPDLIILQEFDIHSQEAKDFTDEIDRLGYRLGSEAQSKRPSMTAFFISKSINYKRICNIHERDLRSCAVEIDNLIVYGTHVPPKYDKEFWDEIERFVLNHSSRNLIMIGDFNTINRYNKDRFNKLLMSMDMKDVWTSKGNSDPISKAGDYAVISSHISLSDVEIVKDDTLKNHTDHPAVILSLNV